MISNPKSTIPNLQSKETAPLADRMRPRTLGEFVGQTHLLEPGKVLHRLIQADKLPSLILWGPPGTGKTTLAHIAARETQAHFISFSAVLMGLKELRGAVQEAQDQRSQRGRGTLLFVDEIHRFNKAQQDAFLPHVERGAFTLWGATTENPSFEVIPALLSRCKVFVLHPLSDDEVLMILRRALEDEERGLGKANLHAEEEVLLYLAQIAGGDARIALNSLEIAFFYQAEGKNGEPLTLTQAQEALQRRSLLYDKAGEEHYNLISALHKSLRGSDPDAALYWLGRMLEAGEDPLYIARRLVRFASEDVGNADPQALQVTVAAMQAYHFIGMPEGSLALAQAVVYLATAPKSNALYAAYHQVQQDIQRAPYLPVPLHIRNAPTRLMKDFGYGRGYKYAHDYPDQFVEQEYLPDKLRGRIYYRPEGQGFEAEIKRRLEQWWAKKKKNKEP